MYVLIVSIVSYRGGSGKSLFALNLAHQINKQIILIEADFIAPALHFIPEKIDKYWNDYILETDTCQYEDLINKIENFDLIVTKPNDPKMISIIHDKKFWSTKLSDRIVQFINDKKKQYDLVLFDNQGGTFYSTLLHCFFSDFLICVVRPDYNDVITTRDYLNILKKPYYLVWNQVIKPDKVIPRIHQWINEHFKDMETFQGVLGFIPFDEESAYMRWIERKAFLEGTEYYNSIITIADKITKMIDSQ